MDNITLAIILICVALVVMNVIGLLSMFIDKQRAIAGKWRIRESVLLSIAFLGGGIGSWVGMYAFRHKTKHLTFVIGVPLLTILSYGAIIACCVLFLI